MKRAVKNLTRGVGGMLGLPSLALINATEFVAAPFAKEPTAKVGDLETLAWRGSAPGASAAEAVEKLKAQGLTLTQARAALRRAMKAKGISGPEQRKRLWRLSNVWHAQRQKRRSA